MIELRCQKILNNMCDGYNERFRKSKGSLVLTNFEAVIITRTVFFELWIRWFLFAAHLHWHWAFTCTEPSRIAGFKDQGCRLEGPICYMEAIKCSLHNHNFSNKLLQRQASGLFAVEINRAVKWATLLEGRLGSKHSFSFWQLQSAKYSETAANMRQARSAGIWTLPSSSSLCLPPPHIDLRYRTSDWPLKALNSHLVVSANSAA